jgi:hypothetical protein
MAIAIRIEAGKCYAKSPYHPDFISEARKLNGKWISPEWSFDARDVDRVKEKLRSIYGTAGEETATCTIRVPMDRRGYGSEIYVAGRLVAKRSSRDSKATIGEGVVIVEGMIPDCGGSVKNPRVNFSIGAVVEIRDVPLGIAREWCEKESDSPITIVEGSIRPLKSTETTPRDAAIAKIREMMATHGISVADLS